MTPETLQKHLQESISLLEGAMHLTRKLCYGDPEPPRVIGLLYLASNYPASHDLQTASSCASGTDEVLKVLEVKLKEVKRAVDADVRESQRPMSDPIVDHPRCRCVSAPITATELTARSCIWMNAKGRFLVLKELPFRSKMPSVVASYTGNIDEATTRGGKPHFAFTQREREALPELLHLMPLAVEVTTSRKVRVVGVAP